MSRPTFNNTTMVDIPGYDSSSCSSRSPTRCSLRAALFLAGTPARPDAAREGPQVPAALITSLQPVSEADLEADPMWVFAPIGVATNFEVDAINLAQIDVRPAARSASRPTLRSTRSTSRR